MNQAGRRLLDLIKGRDPGATGLTLQIYAQAVEEIETEAAADERRRIADAVLTIPTTTGYITVADVLEEVSPEPTIADLERAGAAAGEAWQGLVSFEEAVKRLAAKGK